MIYHINLTTILYKIANPNLDKSELRIERGWYIQTCRNLHELGGYKTDKKNTSYFDFNIKNVHSRIKVLELKIRNIVQKNTLI